MEPILEAKKLNLWYGPNHALHDVSIAIPEHEITAFIGPSGCGKSTFLRTLNRMNDLIPGVKLSGEVDFHGQDLYGSSVDPTWLRKQIGMVFQKANPFPMSIYDNVAYGPRTHGIRNRVKLDEIVENSLRSAAIWDWCESELDLDVRFPAPQTEDTLDCALLEGELASQLLAALREQDLPELAAEIAPDWDLPTEAVQSGLNTLRSHLELVQGDAALLYEMT